MNHIDPESQNSTKRQELIERLVELEEYPEGSHQDTEEVLHTKQELDSLVSYLHLPNPLEKYEGEQALQHVLNDVKSISDLLQKQANYVSRPDRFLEQGTFDRFEIIDSLGQGGMGNVYRVKHLGLNKLMALKTLSNWRMRDPRYIARFQREMKAVGTFDHPNIVKALDSGQSQGIHYLTMELVDGINLSSLVRQSGTLAVSDACEIVRQVAEGLQYIHDRGFVHRDLKPSNLMLTREGQVKILDLGLARVRGMMEEDVLTRTGQVMGTIDYMAPEQALDFGDVDHRADIYSLGVTLFKLLTGTTPFSSEKYDNPLKKTRAMLDTPTPSIVEFRPGVPTALAEIIARMLARNPTDRPQTASEVISLLELFSPNADLPELFKYSQGMVSLSDRSVSSNSREKSWWREMAVASGIILLLSLGIFIWRNLPHNVLSGNFTNDDTNSAASPAEPISEADSTVEDNLKIIKKRVRRSAEGGSMSESTEESVLFRSIGPALADASFGPPFFFRSIQNEDQQKSVILAASLYLPGNRERGALWSSEAGWIEPGTLEQKVEHILGVSRDGSKLILDLGNYVGIWERGRGVTSLPDHEYSPQFLSADGNRIVETYTPAVEPDHFALSVYDLAADRHRFLDDIDSGFDPRVLAADDDLSIIVGTCKTLEPNRTSNSTSERSWIWTSNDGLQFLEDYFEQSEISLENTILLTGMSANGRFLYGTDSSRCPFVWDRTTKNNLSERISVPQATVTGVSANGDVIVGYTPQRHSLIQKGDTPPQDLNDILRDLGVSEAQMPQSQVLGLSPNGRFLWGLQHQQQMTAWILDLQELTALQQKTPGNTHQQLQTP